MIKFPQDVMRNVSPSTLDPYVSPTELLLASQTPGTAFLGSTPLPRLSPTSHVPQPLHDESGPSPSEIVDSAVSSTGKLSDPVLRFLMTEADEDFELDAGLRASSNPATAALKFLHVILVRHDRYALTLLDIIPDLRATALLTQSVMG
ncbi:hypothetical protein PGT21_033929 [Puccinia graminis f. sp. tritici]|uniref:Uncharacterized protein n=1 Tax=Puccinia graminis f. sp. tritici TaxID=56615 RepID=A0A5B0Q965_PUCGR|nr:hypothetical protein PGT21_033929 [Puccinia graminis f. sp. tritici]KAA1109816.1 hypothetical protein PGTUg99_035435 [Puccinia graminis f. sp. tritici]